MIHRITKIKDSEKFVGSLDVNVSIPIQLIRTVNELPQCEIAKVINSSEQYFTERNKSCCYRFYGTVKPVYDNCLIEPSQITEIQNLFDVTDINDVVSYNNFCFYTTGECDTVPIEPSITKLSLNEDNWYYKITYPSECSQDFTIGGVSISDGIVVLSATTLEIGGREMTAFVSAIPHGFAENDDVTVTINGTSTPYHIFRLGLEDGTGNDNIFVIETSYTFVATDKIYFKRSYQGQPSTYYARYFTEISGDVDVFNTAFSKTIYGDQVVSYASNLDLCDLLDCFEKPTEYVYLTVIKDNENFVEGKRWWGEIQSGLDTSFPNDIPFDVNTLTYVGLDGIENDIRNTSPRYFGDIVEYNPLESTTKVLAPAYHRFNSIERSDNGYREGYYYRSHHPIKVRNYSSYVEYTFNPNDSFPDWTVSVDNGKFVWRDLLSYGASVIEDDAVDPPFLNGCHYIYNDFCLPVRRQDPCNLYELGTPNPIMVECTDTTTLIELELEDPC